MAGFCRTSYEPKSYYAPKNKSCVEKFELIVAFFYLLGSYMIV